MQALNALSMLFRQGQASGSITKARLRASAGFHASVSGGVHVGSQYQVLCVMDLWPT